MAKRRTKSGFFWLMALLVTLLAAVLAIGGSTYILCREAYPRGYGSLVESYSVSYGVDEDLTYAVIRSESRFNPDAVSNIGACGLMQITQETYEWAKSRMGEDDGTTYADIFEPEVNIKYGVYILSLLLDEFNDERTAIAAYHAGWGNVKKWLSDPDHSANGTQIDSIPFDNTNAYVNQVINSQAMYQKLYPDV